MSTIARVGNQSSRSAAVASGRGSVHARRALGAALGSRMGADALPEALPPLVRRLKDEGRAVVWSSDPMHGNTYKSYSGYKTRHFEDILKELTHFFQIHEAEGTIPGGVHFELTGDNVTGKMKQRSSLRLQGLRQGCRQGDDITAS